MVRFQRSISPDHQHLNMATKSVNSTNPCFTQFRKNKKFTNSPCEQPRTAIFDVIILIAVIFAIGFLLYPYAKIISHKTVQFGEEIVLILGQEIVNAPIVFGCLGLSLLFAVTALVTIVVCSDRKCGKISCLGLGKEAEFDIQLEVGECVRKSTYLAKNGLKNGLFELTRDRYRELESELRKMAPQNGRAILEFRGRCGCSVGRMEVSGQRKNRKVKK